jgi:beta-1,4-glucosyltransferase
MPRSAARPLAPTDAALLQRGSPVRRFGSGRVLLGGFRIRDLQADLLVRFLRGRLRSGRKIAVGFVNHNFVIECQRLGRGACRDDGLLLVNDGIGMQVAALLRFGRGFRENLNGTDFVPRFLRQADLPLTVYLVGGEPAVVRHAAAIITALPNCRVVGFCDGFSLWSRQAEVLADIGALSPDVLLVGLGNPLQERWVTANWNQIDARLIFGVGALFEWMTGRRRRAPSLVRRLRCEWVYRLLLEPRRLLHRYTIGILHFFTLVLGRRGELIESEARP